MYNILKLNYLQIVLVIFQLLFLKVIIAPAQKVGEVVSAKANYDLLLTRFKVYIEYFMMKEEVKRLYDEALQYAQSDEYEIAAIMLEEALIILKEDDDSSQKAVEKTAPLNSVVNSSGQGLKFSIITGMDFNRQEFEVGFLESDSTVKEEFNKPYLGLSTRYSLNYGEEAFFELYNAIRYDKENWRGEYRLRWQPFNDFYIQYAGYWSQARVTDSNSYWDHMIMTKLNSQLSNDFYWSLYNTFDYKYYFSDNSFIRDFYRNRFNTLGEWRTFLAGIISLEYGNEINETLYENIYDSFNAFEQGPDFILAQAVFDGILYNLIEKYGWNVFSKFG